MTPRTRLALLIFLALASAGAIAWVWFDQHELLWPALLGTLPLIKKLFAWKTLLALLKKAPWFIAAGFKKYVIKIIGSITTLHVGLRFPWVQSKLDWLKERAQTLLTKVQAHWQTMGIIEKTLLILLSVALAVLAVILIVLSKSLQLLTLRKGGETTAAQLVKHSVPKAVNDKLKTLTEKSENTTKPDQES